MKMKSKELVKIIKVNKIPICNNLLISNNNNIDLLKKYKKINKNSNKIIVKCTQKSNK
jgi:hypothetical protein